MTVTSLMILAGVVSFALVLMGLGIVVILRDLRRAQLAKAKEDEIASDEHPLAGMLGGIAAQVDRIEAGLLRQGEVLSEQLVQATDDLRAVRTDIDWMAGDRMIEQAINLARTGRTLSEISGQTGLSEDTVHTISLFHRN